MTPSQLTKAWGIALTGGIATGKSTVAAILRSKGFLVINADYLARLAVRPGSPGLAAIVDQFGDQFLAEDGTLDRKKLASCVFADQEKLKALESIIHPQVQHLLDEELVRSGIAAVPSLWFYEIPLVFEKNRQNEFLQVWATYCPPEVQIKRLMARDGYTEQQAAAIIASQIPSQQKRDLATRWIDTSGSFERSEQQILDHLRSLRDP